MFLLLFIQCTNLFLLYSCPLCHIIIIRYDEILPSKPSNKFLCIQQWSTFAPKVEAGYQGSLDWIKENCQSNVDHHHILAGWGLSLSQRFLIMYTKVCDQLSNKLSRKHFGELIAMIGFDMIVCLHDV